MTNFDKIKQMSVEEMAELISEGLSRIEICPYCKHDGKPECRIDGACKDAHLKWLESESDQNSNI